MYMCTLRPKHNAKGGSEFSKKEGKPMELNFEGLEMQG